MRPLKLSADQFMRLERRSRDALEVGAHLVQAVPLVSRTFVRSEGRGPIAPPQLTVVLGHRTGEPTRARAAALRQTEQSPRDLALRFCSERRDAARCSIRRWRDGA